MALELAREVNAEQVHVELGSQSVVQMLNQPMKSLGVAGPWVEEIKMMLQSCAGFKVSWVRRPTNIATHKFAKLGVENELCKVW